MKYLLLMLLAGAAQAESCSYWIQPCSPEISAQSGCEAADPELAEWALAAWQKAGEGRFTLTRTNEESKSRIRVYWATAPAGMYGEARPIWVEGKEGDRKSTRLNSSHSRASRMPSSA